MNDIKKLEKEALDKAMDELESSEEMKKLKQQQARINDRIARLKKKESEKERRERNHRLIFLGANVEKFFGCKIEKDSKEMACLIYYLPKIKDFFDNGKFDNIWENMNKSKEKEE